jgi:hypothetical protein
MDKGFLKGKDLLGGVARRLLSSTVAGWVTILEVLGDIQKTG